MRPKLSFTLAAGANPLSDGAQIDAPTVTVTAKASSTQSNLAALFIRVNGVPLATSGLLLEPAGRSIDRSVEVPLGHGRNFIAVSVVDDAGRESLRSEAIVVRSGEAVRTLYVLSIGVSRYAASEYDLEYAAKDAQDLAMAMQKNTAFSRVVTHTLLDQQVTREGVLALKEKLNEATADDAVAVFYAGHGVLDDALGYWLAAHDMQFASPSARGISYESLEGLLDGVAARQRLLLIDACHSGEADADDAPAIPPLLSAVGMSAIEVKTRGLKTKTRVADPQRQTTARLMRELFLDTRPSNGSVVLTSASGAERAIESGTLKNGLFTFALIEGLTHSRADQDLDGGVSTGELIDYARSRVHGLSFGAQSPTARREARRFDFMLTRSAR